MPYPDNFNSALFDAQFADDDAVTHDDARRWFKGLMARVSDEFDALMVAVKRDYDKHLGPDAPTLKLRHDDIADTVAEMIGDDVEWGEFRD